MLTDHLQTSQILDKIGTSRRPYVITGSRASFQYHHWLHPAPKIIELRIYPEDYEYWKDSLQGEAIYVSKIPPTTDMMESLDAAVLLTRNLNAQIYHNKRTFADLHYESPEDLCIEFLQNSVAEITAMETLAIWLVQRLTFRWDYFCEQATVHGLTREGGILLDVINEHTQQSLMPQAVIDRLFCKTGQADGMNDRYYPYTWRVKLALRRQNEKELAVTYPRTSQKWGVKVVLPRYIMDKLVLDLDYALPDQFLGVTSDFENMPAVANIGA
jgi:hypothetical protein